MVPSVKWSIFRSPLYFFLIQANMDRSQKKSEIGGKRKETKLQKLHNVKRLLTAKPITKYPFFLTLRIFCIFFEGGGRGRLWVVKSFQIVEVCSNHLNTGHQNTRFIWIPETMNVQYSNGKDTWLGWPFEYQTYWTINRLYSDQTQIYHLNTWLVWYSDGYCSCK